MSELKNPERELYLFRRRLALAGGIVVFLFMVLLGRFVFLQVVMQSHYQTLAESNRISLIPAVPNRGVITDRNGVVLAQSFSAYTLEVTPSKVKNLEDTIEGLSTLVEITARDRKRFRKLLDESKNFESMPLRTRLSDEEVARFAVNRYRFPGVEIKARLFRQYPFGEVASHVIGYIGRINDDDLDRIEQRDASANYKGSDYIGKVGIELSYESELHGTTGLEEVEVDAGGRAVRVISRTPPISGNNLQLSLDIKLQQVAEQAFGDKRGALVALDPNTGEVLAFVSKPGYDPNLFVEGIDPQNWDLLNNSPDKPLLNRPLRGAYPPGSTFKPFMALAALSLEKRTPQQSISDPGFFVLAGGHRFNDDKVGGHGRVDMYRSIVVSCDTYYYQLASELEIDDLAGVMRQFGFGVKSGIDIEGELTGVLPSREWKRQRFAGKQFREEHRKWYLGDNISVGIGQGYNAYTPLQLAHATATIATNGAAYKPHLVKSIHNTRSGNVTHISTQPTHTIPIKPEHWETVKNAMVGVNKEGTGTRAFAGAAYIAGGKTGTAQVYSLKGEKYDAKKVAERMRDHALFIAYAPADKPTIALAVLVENGGFGAVAAAPIARQVLDFHITGKTGKSTPLPVKDPMTTSLIRQAVTLLVRRIDGFLLFTALAIASVGLIVLYSATDASATRLSGQAINLLFALCVMWVAANVPPQHYMRWAVPLFAVGVMLLVAVAVFGTVVNGSRRWLSLGITRIQPSEMMKIAMPLLLAWYFNRQSVGTIRARDFLIAALLILVPVGLIARQPDLGTALLIAGSGFFVLYLAGLNWKVMVLMGMALIALIPVIWPHLHEYQHERVLVFLDPSRDPLGRGYHIVQATIALGSGGLLGKGWLNGTQTHLDFLPERHTDFIFAVYGEEFGLLGGVVLLALYLMLIARGFVITASASNLFTRLLAGAITLMFFAYAFVNMGMVSGILPVVGIPLPLVSFGGTALVTLFLGLGILMSIHAHRKLVKT